MLWLMLAHSKKPVETKYCEIVGIAVTPSGRFHRCCRHHQLLVSAANSANVAGAVVVGIAGETGRTSSIAAQCWNACCCSVLLHVTMTMSDDVAGCDTSRTMIDIRRADTDGSVPSWFCRRCDADGGRIRCRCPTARRPHGLDRIRMIGHVCRSRNALLRLSM